MSERSVAIIGKGMIGISLAVLFTGNGIPTIVLAKNSEVGLKKYRTYYKDLISQGLVTEKQAPACEKRLSFTENYADLAVDLVFDLRLFGDALNDYLNIRQVGVVFREGQPLFTGGGLLFRDETLGDQVLVVGAVFFQTDLAIFGKDDGGNAVAGEQHS